MEEKNMYITSVINLDLWNAAKWRATVIATNGVDYPILGIAFENEQAGKKIFEEWTKRFGNRDVLDEIRISIIEGDIPGLEPGYTVHINTNVENAYKRLERSEMKPEDTIIATIGRFNRMNPSPDSKNLSTFKHEYFKHKKYAIIPVYIDKNMKMIPFYELAIEKQEIVFRDAKDIKENDLDFTVFSSNAK